MTHENKILHRRLELFFWKVYNGPLETVWYQIIWQPRYTRYYWNKLNYWEEMK